MVYWVICLIFQLVDLILSVIDMTRGAIVTHFRGIAGGEVELVRSECVCCPRVLQEEWSGYS